MPELTKREDIYYLRDALMLDVTDEEARVAFMKLLDKSLSSFGTKLNFAIHILANSRRDDDK